MNSKEFSNIIKSLIDRYWALELSKEETAKKINELLADPTNRIKVFRGDQMTAVFKRVLGLRRLEVFNQMYQQFKKNN